VRFLPVLCPPKIILVEGAPRIFDCPQCHAVHEEFFKEHMRTKGKELAEACVAIIGQLAAVA
jgi:hypothetical protein